MRSILCHKGYSHLSSVLACVFLSRCKFSTPTNTSLYSSSSINRLYAQNPVFEIVHDESVKAYLHMYNGNVQQNPLYVEPCVTEDFSISPRFSPTIFDPDANSVLLRAHLCNQSTVKYIRGGVSNSIFNYLPTVVYKLYNRRIEHSIRRAERTKELPNIRSKKYRI